MKRKKLFTTEDGVKIYDGDLFWNANWMRNYYIGCMYAYDGVLDKFSNKKYQKNFSTKEAGQKWLKNVGMDPFKYLKNEYLKSKRPVNEKLDDLIKTVFETTKFVFISDILSNEDRMNDLNENNEIIDQWINVKQLEYIKRHIGFY